MVVVSCRVESVVVGDIEGVAGGGGLFISLFPPVRRGWPGAVLAVCGCPVVSGM